MCSLNFQYHFSVPLGSRRNTSLERYRVADEAMLEVQRWCILMTTAVYWLANVESSESAREC